MQGSEERFSKPPQNQYLEFFREVRGTSCTGGRRFVEAKEIAALADRLIGNLTRVVRGKTATLELAVAALLAEGHILLEDVPGVGKTVLAKALARSIGGRFHRIQCTPDLLPSDVLGVSIYDGQRFVYHQGPVFTHILLADEINRATPRTQASLLECMEERQVSVEGESRPLERPFLVMATQNPIEYEGTFVLPEAQLDRFLVQLSLGYPDAEEEVALVAAQQLGHPLEQIGPVLELDEVTQAIDGVKHVHVSDAVRSYGVGLVRATRGSPGIRLGASPRGSLGLLRLSQALAACRGHAFVLPDDVQDAFVPTLRHRILLAAESQIGQVDRLGLLHDILERMPVPTEQLAK